LARGSRTGIFALTMPTNLTELCVCGHQFQDHTVRNPKRCTETHVSGRYACPCTAFVSKFDRSSPLETTLRAASSGATMAYERMLRTLPEPKSLS
jgi:hypothetical protein